jgi:hypothetical protein
MGKNELKSQLIINTTDSIKGSILEKVNDSINSRKSIKEIFELEGREIAALEQKIIDSLGTIYNHDAGYIVIALRSLAIALENKSEADPEMEMLKRMQIKHLEKSIEIMAINKMG